MTSLFFSLHLPLSQNQASGISINRGFPTWDTNILLLGFPLVLLAENSRVPDARRFSLFSPLWLTELCIVCYSAFHSVCLCKPLFNVVCRKKRQINDKISSANINGQTCIPRLFPFFTISLILRGKTPFCWSSLSLICKMHVLLFSYLAANMNVQWDYILFALEYWPFLHKCLHLLQLLAGWHL